MEITALGFILLPLTLILIPRPSSLLQITFLASAFGGAVPFIVPFGGERFALPPDFLPGIVFIAVVGLDYMSRNLREIEGDVVRTIFPMIVFVAIALAGAAILPRLFMGEFRVWPQRPGFFNSAILLAPNAGNVTQCLYLIVDTSFLVLAALYVSRTYVRSMTIVHAYLASGYLVVALTLWQFASKLTGIYYPEHFLYSNPRWAILTNQAVGNVHRINGPFVEPAALATYLSGVAFACLWLLLRGHGSIWIRMLFLLSLLAILLSTSTTGIIIVTLVIPAILLRYAIRRESRFLGVALAGVVGGVLAIGIITYLSFPSFFFKIQMAMSTIIDATLNKSGSISYVDRTTIDLDSLSILVPSLGFGAGWGSVRSSSLIPGVLGNSGIPGLVLLCWFARRLMGLVAKARQTAATGESSIAMNAMLGSVVGTLCAALISGPFIEEIDFFLRLAIVIGCAARIYRDAHIRALAPVAVLAFPISSRIQPRSNP
jgi:hypothetical protein